MMLETFDFLTCPHCGMHYETGRDPYSHNEDRILFSSRRVNRETEEITWNAECSACNRKFEIVDHPAWSHARVQK